jgi:O-antigen/teichoic acid export membrane protein
LALRPDFLLVVLGRLATALIAVVSLRIMTVLLSPSDYGLWALLVAFQSFCGLFLINPVGRHINRHTHAWWDDGTLLRRLAKFDRYIWLVSLFITVAVVFWWNYNQSDGRSNHVLELAAGLAIGAIVYLGTWNVTFVSLLNMLGFRVQSVIWMVASALVGLVFSSLFVMQYTHAISWIFGQALGALVGALGARRALRSHLVKGVVFDRKITFKDFLNHQTILTFCIPLAAATGFMWLQNTAYRFLVGGVWGVAELGILAVGLGVSAQLAAIIESLAMQFLNPYFYRRISDAKSDDQSGAALSDLMNVLAPIYAIWAGFNAICAAALLELLTDTRYHAAAPFVIFGAMIEFARCLTNLWSNAAQVKRRTNGVILPYGLGAAVVWLGATGAAQFEAGLIDLSFVLVASGIVTCVTMIILMQRLLPISIDVPRSIIGLGVMGACFTMASMPSLHTFGLYQNLVLLLISGIVACLLVVAMLWRNPALSRLLSASLRTS